MLTNHVVVTCCVGYFPDDLSNRKEGKSQPSREGTCFHLACATSNPSSMSCLTAPRLCPRCAAGDVQVFSVGTSGCAVALLMLELRGATLPFSIVRHVKLFRRLGNPKPSP